MPPTHGFMISTSSMRNVWLSMEHQVILWCNEVVVQVSYIIFRNLFLTFSFDFLPSWHITCSALLLKVSHTLLSLIESKTGQPFSDSRKRLAIFAKMLRSGVPESWLRQSHLSQQLPHVNLKNGNVAGIINLNHALLCDNLIYLGLLNLFQWL